MDLIKVLAVIVVTLSSPYLSAQSICLPQSIDDARVSDRAKSIEFPDGRKITLVGHLHGDRQVRDFYDLFVSEKMNNLSGRQFAELLKSTLAENQTTLSASTGSNNIEGREQLRAFGAQLVGDRINDLIADKPQMDLMSANVLEHAKEDLGFLQDMTKFGTDIRFIGLEANYEDAQGIIENYASVFHAMKRSYYAKNAQSQGLNLEQFEEAMLSSINGNIFGFIQNPELSQRVRMIGTESSIVSALVERIKPKQMMEQRLNDLFAADERYWEGLDEAERLALSNDPKNQLFGALLVQTHNDLLVLQLDSTKLENAIDYLSHNSPAYLRPLLAPLFKAWRTRLELQKKRDEASARTLVAQFESGIHFVGANHFKHTLHYLVELCKDELRKESGR